MRAAAGSEEHTIHPCEQQNDGMDGGTTQGRLGTDHWPSSLKVWSVLVKPWGRRRMRSRRRKRRGGRGGGKGEAREQPAGGAAFALPLSSHWPSIRSRGLRAELSNC